MDNNTEDYNIKRGKHMEGIADEHLKLKEYDKALKLYKDAFNNFKKGKDKESALRVKDKFDQCKKNLEENKM
ncbi:MAG: hypothetical protein ACTSRZ_04155 [Promethearchaeota archaeon]